MALVIFCGFYLNNASAGDIPSLKKAEDAPTLQRNILKIPRVDTLDKVGEYQNVEFELAADGRWDLVRVNEAQLAYVYEIEIEIIQSDPVQVHVLVSGALPSPCHRIKSINKRYKPKNRLFEVSINVAEPKKGTACIAVLESFNIVVPLDVYGLPAGNYQVYVNGKSASFILDKENI